MGLHVQRAAGRIAGEPYAAGAGIRRGRDTAGENSHGLFKLRLLVAAAMAAGRRGDGHLERGGDESCGLGRSGDKIRPHRAGTVLHVHRRRRRAARGVVRGRAQRPRAAGAGERIRPRGDKLLDREPALPPRT